MLSDAPYEALTIFWTPHRTQNKDNPSSRELTYQERERERDTENWLRPKSRSGNDHLVKLLIYTQYNDITQVTH